MHFNFFTGFHLIAYVKSWLNILNDIAAKEGTTAFRFNTYIIAVLVVFFLQMNHNFPKLRELPSSQTDGIASVFVPKIDKERLKHIVEGFFEFYGKKYQFTNMLISPNIGRWQERQQPAQQTKLTSEQKRFDICFC